MIRVVGSSCRSLCHTLLVKVMLLLCTLDNSHFLKLEYNLQASSHNRASGAIRSISTSSSAAVEELVEMQATVGVETRQWRPRSLSGDPRKQSKTELMAISIDRTEVTS